MDNEQALQSTVVYLLQSMGYNLADLVTQNLVDYINSDDAEMEGIETAKIKVDAIIKCWQTAFGCKCYYEDLFTKETEEPKLEGEKTMAKIIDIRGHKGVEVLDEQYIQYDAYEQVVCSLDCVMRELDEETIEKVIANQANLIQNGFKSMSFEMLLKRFESRFNKPSRYAYLLDDKVSTCCQDDDVETQEDTTNLAKNMLTDSDTNFKELRQFLTIRKDLYGKYLEELAKEEANAVKEIERIINNGAETKSSETAKEETANEMLLDFNHIIRGICEQCENIENQLDNIAEQEDEQEEAKDEMRNVEVRVLKVSPENLLEVLTKLLATMK